MAFDWQAGLMHPLTRLGAGLMMGSDPRRQGTYGFGYGLQQAQQGIQEQQRYQAEQERAAQLADLQMRLMQAKLGAQQEAQGVRERAATWAEGQGEAEQVDPVAAWQAAQTAKYRAPSSAQTTLGKLNQDLAAGRITQDQYNQRSAQLSAPKHTPLGDGSYLTNYPDGRVVHTLASGVSRELSKPGISTQQITQPQETEVQEQMQPVEPKTDEFTIHQRTQAIKGLPTEVQKAYTSAESVAGEIPSIIAQVEANPGAFSKMIGGAYYLPEQWQGGTLSKIYTEMQESGLTPQEQAARIAVFRNASNIIKELSGSAVSESEKERINQFLPKANDTPEKVATKLRDALDYAQRTQGRISTDYNIPQVREQVDEMPWTERGGVRYREVR